MQTAEAYPHPRSGEGPREYTERLNASDAHVPYTGLMDHFGFSAGAAKSMWIASVEFNQRFAFNQWSERRERSSNDYGANNWLRKKFQLEADELQRIVEGFEAGDAKALGKVLKFSDLVQRRTTPDDWPELKAAGVISFEGIEENQ